MKKASAIFRTAVNALCLLAALAFAVIEGWLLFAADWSLFENSALALVQACLRFGLALGAMGVSLCALLNPRRRLAGAGLGMLAAALAAAPFLCNHFGWCPVGLAALFTLAQGLRNNVLEEK